MFPEQQDQKQEQGKVKSIRLIKLNFKQRIAQSVIYIFYISWYKYKVYMHKYKDVIYINMYIYIYIYIYIYDQRNQ